MKLSKLEWQDGNKIITFCKNKEALRVITSEALYQSISLYTKETSENNVKIMTADLLDKYQYDSFDVIVEAIKDIRQGKRKIFGLVTPHDIHSIIEEKLNDIAIQRERNHEKNKGFANQEHR